MQHRRVHLESNRGETEHVKAAELLHSCVGLCNNLQIDYYFSHKEKSELPAEHKAATATIAGKKYAV